MEAINYKNILLNTAVCAIACDGDVDAREIDALKNIEKKLSILFIARFI